MTIFARSSLDSRRFGIEVFRGHATDLSAAHHAINLRSSARVDLCIVRVPDTRLDVVQQLERGGFFLCDVLVEFAGPTDQFEVPDTLPHTLEIRRADHDDHADLAALARVAFSDFSGHYHQDRRIDPALATEGYVEWCLSALTRPSSFVLLARVHGEAAGFLTANLGDDGRGEVVLNGVDPRFQRRGIYSALFSAVGYRFRTEGVSIIWSSTQLGNTPPQKVWARNGLMPLRSWFTLHKWYEAEPERA